MAKKGKKKHNHSNHRQAHFKDHRPQNCEAEKPQRQKSRGKVDLSAWDFDGNSKELQASLHRFGLKLKDMTGDGNCLFRSLSDQIFGNPTQHLHIRARVVNHISQNRPLYEPFLAFDQEGRFDAHVDKMAKGGCYGGNIELVAFAREFNSHVFLHQANAPVWVIRPELEESAIEREKKNVHIAYHSWEHYSSVRNIDGPTEGPPEITIKHQEISNDNSRSVESNDGPPSSLEITIMKTIGLDDLNQVRTKLRACKGDPNRVINELYTEMENLPEDAKVAESNGLPENSNIASSRKSVENENVERDFCINPEIPSEQSMIKPTEILEMPKTSNPLTTTEETNVLKPPQEELSIHQKKQAAKKSRKKKAIKRKGKHKTLTPANAVNSNSNTGSIVNGIAAISI